MARAKLFMLFFWVFALAPAFATGQEGAAESGRLPRESVATRRSKGMSASPVSTGWWVGTALMILALGGAGAVCIAARKQGGVGSGVKLQVVGRVHLPPRHAVFAVKAGDRTLLIGTGPQGAPALLGELEDEPAETFAPAVAAASPAPHRPPHLGRFDVRIGEES